MIHKLRVSIPELHLRSHSCFVVMPVETGIRVLKFLASRKTRGNDGNL